MGAVNVQLDEKGYCLIKDHFSECEIGNIKNMIAQYMLKDHPGIVMEKDGETVRGLHGLHLYDSFFDALVKNEKLLSIAKSYLGEECYVHQFKVNIKKAFVGESWPWHEDFVYWYKKDGIQNPAMLNVGVFLDDMEPLSGPLCVIPNSHRCADTQYGHTASDEDWKQDLSSDLTYKIDEQKITSMIRENGYEFVLGRKGDVFVFNPLVAHCSSVNMSPCDRAFMIVTYNRVCNPPRMNVKHKRPEFLCTYNIRSLAI